MSSSRARIVFPVLLSVLAAAFFCAHAVIAKRRGFSEDEGYAYNATIRDLSPGRLLVGGAVGQGSPAPLSYLLDQAMDCIPAKAVAPELSRRLPANLAVTLAGVIVGMLLYRRVGPGRPAALGVALLAVLAFYLHRDTWHFASQMRPYALWEALWWIVLASSMLVSLPDWGLAGLGVLLAMTSTASLFQITALAAAEIVIAADRRSAGLRALKVWLLPAAVALYYVLRSEPWNQPTEIRGTWGGFARFWLLKNIHVWAAAIAMLVLGWGRPDRRAAWLGGATSILLLLLAPAIFWLTQSRGFFFSPRHFLYYGLVPALAIASLSASLPPPETMSRGMRWGLGAGVAALLGQGAWMVGRDLLVS